MYNSAPFPSIVYSLNPAFFQPGQAVTISPVPGTSATNYVVSSGTLSTGLTLNNLTGVISGTAGSVAVPNTVTISGTMPDSSIFNVNVTVTITDIPLPAIDSNEASAMTLVALMQYDEINFIKAANQMILNAEALGKFYVVLDVPHKANIKTLRAYYQSLKYNFDMVYWRAESTGGYVPYLGDFSDPWRYPYGLNYPRAGYPQESQQLRKVRITWFATPFCSPGSIWLNWWPWGPWC
jgi:hypothetical protein